MMRTLLPSSLLVLSLACGGPAQTTDGGAHADDAGADANLLPQSDAGTSDGGLTDSGVLDAGTDEDAGTQQDAGTDAGIDAGEPESDAGLDGGSDAGAPVPEMEPNDANPATNTVTAPGAVSGAIGTAADRDVFTVNLAAGQQWRWTLDSKGSALAPHLVVVESANDVPILLAQDAVGGSATIEQLVLKTGVYAVIVRDSRNVASSQGEGSASHVYELRGEALNRNAVPLTLPGTATGTLANPFGSALYRFTLNAETPVTLQVKAKTKNPPSDVDTRLTLFDATRTQWAGTNDDQSLSNSDSLLTGTLDPGDYWVVVENLNETASILTYELVLTSP